MIEIREVNDLKEAENLWRIISPNKTIFDEWDFRYCFYKYAPLPICFLAADDKKDSSGERNLVGLLPLQKHPKHGFEFFAEDPCEENRPFIKPGYEDIIPKLYAATPGPAKAYDISGDDEYTKALPLEDYKYVLPLTGINNFSDFLNIRLSAKRRRSLAKEISGADKYGVETEIISEPLESRLAALETLFSFNTGNFGEESYLLEKDQAPWRDLMALNFNWRLTVCKIAGVNQAVSLSVLHNNEWHYLVTGVNFKDFPGLGKYLVKVNIEAAIVAKADVFDAGLGDCGWKNLWHFDKISQYNFEKNI
jgi:hypothetical protein